MNVERIDILPHARNPVGNFAIIKLIGINRLEGPPVFTMAPVNNIDGGADPAGWPNGELRPLGVRAGTQSIELLIGPEIVRAVPLRPGVPIRFRMPTANVDMVLEWPALEAEQPGRGAAPSVPPPVPVTPLPLIRDARASAECSSKERASEEKAERGLARLRIKQPRPSETKPAETSPVATEPARAGNQSTMLLPLALGFVIVAAMMVVFVRTTPIEGSGVTLFSALRQAIASEDVGRDPMAEPARVLAGIMSVEEVPPAGAPTGVVSRRQALERANDLLQSAKTPQERAEAAYWLRKALADSLARPRLVWAVTQLGAAYASSDSNDQPNYGAARLLWRWAADAGDAQAACFLGKLHEQGLGVPASVALARRHYQQAQGLGGCPGLKQAMSRVGQ